MQTTELIKNKWNDSSHTIRAMFVGGLVLIAALVLAGSIWIMRDDYQVLFAELSGQDAGAMIGELDRMKVPYKLADNGTTILVERDAVYKTRLKLMSKGLDLHGTVGFEIFNNTDFGTTEFAQKVNYQRAMQGELARTIMGFEEVKHARVHLVLPDSGLFKRQNSKPKASVSLVMKGDSQLLPEQIAGVQRLVAASVPEITPAAVTIVDQRGTAVSQQLFQDEADQNSAGRLDSKKKVEEYLTRKIVAVLDRVIGPGKSIVSVDAQLSYDQIKVTREDVIPLANTSGQNVGAIARRREAFQGQDILAQTGADPARTYGQTASPSSSSETEFINGRKVESIVSATGAIQRLSVGVLVPGITDPVELAKLREVVTMAVGVNQARGDAIAVFNVMPQVDGVVEPPAPGKTTRAAAQDALPISWTGWLIPGALLVLIAAAVLVYGYWRGKPARLSRDEKEKVLQDIAQWAKAERKVEAS